MVESLSGKLVVVDAAGCIAGRLASHVASTLLEGNRVIVINSRHGLISGSRSNILAEMTKRLEISSIVQPKYGPFHPRRPDTIFKRMVRGMLPQRKPRGLAAMKRLRVYAEIPPAYKEAERSRPADAVARRPEAYYISLGELAASIGWKGG